MQMNAAVLATAEIANAGNGQFNVNTIPNVCPICHVTIEPDYLPGSTPGGAFNWLEAYFRCTNKKCRRQFTALYRRAGSLANGIPAYNYERSYPNEPEIPAFDEAVKNLSPDFIRVYGQAIAAEAHGLTDVAGPGFRKSLEFLVKDYAIHLKPEASDDIKAAPLASVIEHHLTGDKVPVVSLRAAWLGNDETHYERRWVDKDIQDLKRLIGATVHLSLWRRWLLIFQSPCRNLRKDCQTVKRPNLPSLHRYCLYLLRSGSR